MTLYEYYDKKVPNYYDGMYLDGYTPQQILHAVHRQMRQAYDARREAERAETEQNEVWNVKITSEVRVR